MNLDEWQICKQSTQFRCASESRMASAMHACDLNLQMARRGQVLWLLSVQVEYGAERHSTRHTAQARTWAA